jgi:predicted transposase YdaD
LAERNPSIRKTVVTVKKLSADEEMRMYAEAKEKARRDAVAEREYAIAEGIRKGIEEALEKAKAKGKAEAIAEGKAEGRAEGKAEGRAEGKAEGKAEGVDITIKAYAALKSGKSVEEAAQISGLDVEKVRMLAE